MRYALCPKKGRIPAGRGRTVFCATCAKNHLASCDHRWGERVNTARLGRRPRWVERCKDCGEERQAQAG